MKKIFTLLLCIVSLASFAQGPKNRDSVTWKEQKLYQGTEYKGGLLDASGSFVLPRNNANRGFRNNLLGTNLDISGTANDVRGNNHVVGNVIGADVSGADHTVYDGADYSTTGGDAHNILGIGAKTGGYGNTNYGRYGTTLGLNNVNGSWSRTIDRPLANKYQGTFLNGNNMRSEGNYIYGHGVNLYLRGDNITAFGYAPPSAPFLYQSANSFIVVHAGKMVLQITEGGQVRLNGVLYSWPASQGAPGSILTNDGQGNLSWSAPSQATTSRVSRPLVATDVLGRQFIIIGTK